MSDMRLEILREARELISNPDRWAQGACAYTADGRQCLVYDPAAVKWCAAGAVYKAAHSLGVPAPVRAGAVTLNSLSQAIGRGVWGFNDAMDHAAVLDMFDRTIATLEQGAPVTIGP